MTQLRKTAKPEKSEKSSKLPESSKLDNDKKEVNASCVTENCIQITAWLLLTIGLCIIGTTFYLAIVQKSSAPDVLDEHAVDEVTYKNPIAGFDKIQSSIGIALDSDNSIRTVDDLLISSLSTIYKGCEEKRCRIACAQADDLYEDLYDTLTYSNCSSIDVLYITNQEFQHGVVMNHWFHLFPTIYEFILTSSNVTYIHTGAFNSGLFSTLFNMLWKDLKLSTVSGGALLGLHSLRYLTIQTEIQAIDRAFFQPVQTTLQHLTLNAGLYISGTTNIFGISCLNYLEYLDLSGNNFDGPLRSVHFQSVPNLKYLHITNAKITSIDSDVFDILVDKLLVVNLSHNLLTKVSPKIFETLLASNVHTVLSLSDNQWVCDCEMENFLKLTRSYHTRFLDALYCRAPRKYYGKFLHEINLEADACIRDTTTIKAITEDYTKLISTTTKAPNVNIGVDDDAAGLPSARSSEEDQSTVDHETKTRTFQMHCLPNEAASDRDSKGDSDSNSDDAMTRSFELSMGRKQQEQKTIVSLVRSKKHINTLQLSDGALSSSSGESFVFERPEHELDLVLFANRSVRATIANYGPSNAVEDIAIIWFSKELEGGTQKRDAVAANFDVECTLYRAPYIITASLRENTTYTFCITPHKKYTISPFNCQPMHVPRYTMNENIWITKDEKQFTIGMLCLIFMLSLFFGAVVAYFGIKTYPELLEGSKNVLVVKKSDQTCYVSTISEADYLKSSTLKKSNSISAALPDMPPSMAPLPPSFNPSVYNLERASSVKSTSLLIDDPWVSKSPNNDEYELPKQYKTDIDYGRTSVQNDYASTPCSPPPLPKRNSSTVEALVPNRFARTN